MLAAAAFLAFGAVDASAQTSDLRLMEAVRLQDSEAVERLLHASADVNAPQADGATALHWAAYLDDVETARLLLEAGADAGGRQHARRCAAVARLHQCQRGDGGSAAGGGC